MQTLHDIAASCGRDRLMTSSSLALWLFVAFGIVLEGAHVAQAAAPTENGTIETHLYALKVVTAQIPPEKASGGAIAPLRNDLLVATPHGSLFLVGRRGEVVAIDGHVPMGLESFRTQAGAWIKRFRVTDILLKRLAKARYQLFVTHLYFTGSCIRFRLSATTIRLGFPRRSPGTVVHVGVGSWKTIFDADPCLATDLSALHQSGGKVLTDGDEHLLVMVGNFNKPAEVQSMDMHVGKLLRIDIDTGAAEVVATGFRNAQGLARDRDGNLWETEHGPQGGDELNILKSGADYGWPTMSYGVDYGRLTLTKVQPAERPGRHDGLTRPVFAWVPSIGISAIAVNDERFFPLWADDLLIGSLSSAASLFRVRRHGRQVSYVERIRLGHLVYEIRDIAQLADGRIALWSSQVAQVRFLSRAYAPYCGPDATPHDVYAVGCPN